MLFVGVDWAEDHHDVCVMTEDGMVLGGRPRRPARLRRHARSRTHSQLRTLFLRRLHQLQYNNIEGDTSASRRRARNTLLDRITKPSNTALRVTIRSG